MIYFAAQDPFQPYGNPGNGKGNPHVPEPATYGFILMAILIAVMMWRRRKR